MNELVTITRPRSVGSISGNVVVPVPIAGAGEHATRRFLEFFAATIRNNNTRMAYYRACCSFFAWLEMNGIAELADIEPIHVAAYIEALQTTNAKPTVKQHLAAVRMLFDWLVVGQVLAINPAHAVRGPKHVVKRGKTPVLVADDARRLLDSIPTTRMVKQPDGSKAEAPCLVGLRDRALIAVMTFALARIGAAVGMRVDDYYPSGSVGGSACTKKAASDTRCRRTINWKRISTSTSRRPASAMTARPPCSGPRSAEATPHREPDAPHRCLSDGSPAHRQCRVHAKARLPRIPCDRNHRLSRRRRLSGKRAGDGGA